MVTTGLPENFWHLDGTGRVRAGRGHATPGGTGADRNAPRRISGTFLDQLNRLCAADLAVDAVVLGRNGTFDDQHIFALVVFHGIFARSLSLMPGSGQQGLVVVE